MLKRLWTYCFTAFGDWLIRRALRTPYSHLRHADGRPYMDRWNLFGFGVARKSGEYPFIGARIHHILSSDDDRAFHDHPWPFISIILRGGYTEIRRAKDMPDLRDPVIRNIGGQPTYIGKKTFAAPAILFRPASTWHMIELAPGQEAVTLFITLPRLQNWGFLWKGKKIAWEELDEVAPGGGIHMNPNPGGDLRGLSPKTRA